MRRLLSWPLSRCHLPVALPSLRRLTAASASTLVLLQQQNFQRGGGNFRRDAPRQRGGGAGGGYRNDRPPRQQQQQQQRRGDDRGGGNRRAPEQFLEQNAQTLVDLKRQFKQAKSAKERRSIQREARQLIRRTRIDPSTQDEKSVTVLLNCAAYFHANVSEGVEQAVQWMRKSLNGLSPQNIALFANALGVLSIPDGDSILVGEISPVVQAVMKEMTPVEVVMVLQAFQRERVGGENADLQDTLLRQLSPCVSQMPVPQLSTLASVIARHPLKERDPATWQSMCEGIMKKALTDVDRMHSKEAIAFLTTAAYVNMPQEQMVQLLRRATATVGFHTAEQVAELFRAIGTIKRLVKEPSEELTQACAELASALVGRLDRVAEFASVRDVASLWKFSKQCGVELPTAVQERLVESLMTELAWVRQSFPQLARLAKAAADQQLPSVDILHALGDYALGRRPTRRDRDGRAIGTPDERSMETISEARSRLYGHFLAPLVALRINLESALAANGGQLSDNIAKVLPEELVRHAAEASPRQTLLALEYIILAPADCPLRNKANDAALVAAVEERLSKEPEIYKERVSPAFIKRVTAVLADAPTAKNTVEVLKTLHPQS